MSYTLQFWIAVVITVILGTIGAIQVADPSKLGINETATEWLKILVVALGLLQGFLPAVTKPPHNEQPSPA